MRKKKKKEKTTNDPYQNRIIKNRAVTQKDKLLNKMKKKENKRKKGEKSRKIDDDKGDKKEKTVRTKCGFLGEELLGSQARLKE